MDSTTDPVLQSRFFLEAYPSLYYLRDGQTRQYLSARNLQHVRCRKATNGIVTAYAAGLTVLEHDHLINKLVNLSESMSATHRMEAAADLRGAGCATCQHCNCSMPWKIVAAVPLAACVAAGGRGERGIIS